MRVVLISWALLTLLLAGTSWAQSCGSAFTTVDRYDLARQLVGTISAPASGVYEAVRNTYDFDGRIIKIERGTLAQCQSEAVLPANWSGFTPLHLIERTYDETGRMLTEKRSGPTLTQYSYDSVGRLECTAVRMNPAVYAALPASACTASDQENQAPDRIIRLIRDAAGQVLVQQRAYGTGIQQSYATYAYTVNGLHDWVEDANGNRTDYTYDGFDRLWRMNLPQIGVGSHVANVIDYEQYGYDENHNATSRRLRSGETVTFGYDFLNRMSSKAFAGTGTTTYTYDNLSFNRSAQTAGGASITNIPNGFGELESTTSTSSSGSLVLSYQYDADGNRTRVTWPDGIYVQYTYDGRNRMDEVRENGAVSGAGVLADYAYDAIGRRSSVSWGNGTNTSFGYDGASRLATLTQNLASTGRDLSLGFTYNNASQVTERTLSNDAYAYFPLTKTKSYTRDGLNRYQSVTGVTYGYDSRGNLTSDGTRTFTYDLENHLLSVSGGAAPVNLTYDPNGRLLTSASGGITTRYLYDGDRIVAEYQGATLVRRYAHGAGVDEPLVWYEGASITDRRWLHTDHQGSVVASSNGSGVGSVYAYGPYGEPAYDNWGGSRFRYTGQITLPEARLYHYKARVYDPALGRLLQTDPVGYADNFNLYAYVFNDPMNHSDPTGTYGQGDGFSDSEWKLFDRVQKQAAKDMERTAGKLEKKADKLDAQKKQGSDVLRTAASNLRAGASDLRSDGSDGKMAHAVDVEAYMKMGGTSSGAARAEVGGNNMWVNKDNKNAWAGGDNEGMLKWVVGHESLHSGAKLLDVLFDMTHSYAFGYPDQRRAFEIGRGTIEGHGKPDNLMDLVYPKFAN